VQGVLEQVPGPREGGGPEWAEVMGLGRGGMEGASGGRPGVRPRTERGVGGVQKQWDKIRKGVNKVLLLLHGGQAHEPVEQPK